MKVNNQMYRGCSTGRCMPPSNGSAPYSPNIGNTASYPPVPTNPATTPSTSNVSAENYQEMLSGLIGSYIITELLIGIDRLVLRQGYLTAVGPSYYILFDPEPAVSTVCDIYSLKFVSFFESRERPTTAQFERWLESLRNATELYENGSGQQ